MKCFVSGGVAAAIAMLGLAGPAAAITLNIMGSPTYGDVRLRAGFTPDPYVTTLHAGGGDQTPAFSAGCVGMVNAAAPDVDFYYTASGNYSLYIYAQSSADTTLVVNGPDGRWYCDDDSIGTDPLVVFDSPRGGLYSIWVGTYGTAVKPAKLFISEIEP